MAQSNSIVAAHGIGKSFGSVRAVDNISFEVHQQQIFSLLGPNGAGKSTLVRMLIGMLPPDEGKFLWQSRESHSSETIGSNRRLDRDKIGYLPEDRGLYKDQPVAATLEYFAALRGLNRADSRKVAQTWMERLELTQYSKSKLETLSKGNQQKVQIATAVLHRPTLVVLDEPFSGLDPINQELMVNLIREIRSEGATILLSAHQLNLIERLADHVMIIAKGREVLSGTVAEICHGTLGGKTLRIEYEHPLDEALLQKIQAENGVQGVRLDQPNVMALSLSANENQLQWLNRLHEWGTVRTFQSSTTTLHEIYLRVVSEPEPEPGQAQTAGESTAPSTAANQMTPNQEPYGDSGRLPPRTSK